MRYSKSRYMRCFFFGLAWWLTVFFREGTGIVNIRCTVFCLREITSDSPRWGRTCPGGLVEARLEAVWFDRLDGRRGDPCSDGASGREYSGARVDSTGGGREEIASV